MKRKIKAYWEERARVYSGDPASTTNDVYLRELEIRTIVQILGSLSELGQNKVLDVGCGEGYSTLQIALALPRYSITGIDYSASMIRVARQRLKGIPSLIDRTEFLVGDVLDLGAGCGGATYDVVLSDRCLINLESKEDQGKALMEISMRLPEGGYYLAVENFVEGQEAMNEARAVIGLPPIPMRWHNLYFTEEEFIELARPAFEIVEFRNFSSAYYFATRVIYAALCQRTGEEIDYRHPLHKLAVNLPWTGNFSPIRIAILKRKTA